MKLHEKVELISKKLEILESLCNKYNLKSQVQPPYVFVGLYFCKAYRFSILQSLSFSQMEELVLNHALEEMGNEY